MNDLLNAIFGLGGRDGQSLGFGTPESQPGFTHALPAWAIVLVMVCIAGAVWWSYRAIPGSRALRGSMAVLRTLLLTLLFVLALGPRIEQTIIETEPDWVMVMLDRSASLGTPDAGTPITSREEQLERMLRASNETWATLSDEKRVVWMGFDERARVLGEGAIPDRATLGNADGLSTDLEGAIHAALRQSAARPISAIVMVSDGRSTQPIDPELIDTLRERQIPIVSVPLGSAEPVRDFSIVRVEHPDAVFADDLVPVRVQIGANGIGPDDLGQSPTRVELVDHDSGLVLDRMAITAEHLPSEGGAGQAITLMHTPERTESGDGSRRLDVRVVSDADRADLNEENNTTEIQMSIVDRPMRVLYIDGYPRWEQRYLKNLLLRERSIVSSALLLSASRRYIQEGDELIASVPATLEDWEPFDVIILGDVRAELFSQQQLETLVEHVETRGAGVLWVAGPSSVPDGYLGTELSSLLPMRRDAGGSQSTSRVWGQEVTVSGSAEATRLGVLRLSDDRTRWLDRLSDPGTGWSKLRWALQLDETSFKPGVSVLASASSVNTGESAPLITMMRYGAGSSIFVGTDEIWRWRYGRGEDLPERFWLPMIRALGRGTVARRAAPAQLVVSPSSPLPDQATQVTLRVFDQQRIDSMPERVRVRVSSIADRGEPVELELFGTGDTRTGTWIPSRAGSFELTPLGLDPAMSAIAQRAQVFDRADERRQLDSDHESLTSLAQQSGGWVSAPKDFARIPEQLPNRARTIASPPRRASLWDRPIVLFVLISLLTAEWVGRRALRLA
jgi:hypothetical protein